jgi:hypothetical protein
MAGHRTWVGGPFGPGVAHELVRFAADNLTPFDPLLADACAGSGHSGKWQNGHKPTFSL